MNLNLDEVKQRLEAANIKITDESRLANDTGTKLNTDCGAIVNVFDTGTCNVQGKHPDRVKAALGAQPLGAAAPAARAENHTKVFVVYGHDTTARGHLEAMLRR